jgi:hypothetical protein
MPISIAQTQNNSNKCSLETTVDRRLRIKAQATWAINFLWKNLSKNKES